jgi:hypothetical protein
VIFRGEADLERMQAAGEIGVEDADAVRRFASFLEAAGPHHGCPDFDPQRFADAYRQHYPEDYARAIAEHRARTTTQEETR